MNIKNLLNKDSDLEISKYDYASISTKADQLYYALLYRDIYQLDNREEKEKELAEYIAFFNHLPNVRKITKYQFLDRLYTLYQANLALCKGEVAVALKLYFKVLSVRELNRKINDIRSKKCSRVELCDLMPLVYNIEKIYRLVGLDNKADAYLSLCNQAIFMWEEKMGEVKSDGFVFHPIRDPQSFFKSSYEICCEEYFDKNIGRVNYRFNSGLDEYEVADIKIVKENEKEYYKIGLCSILLDKEKLETSEAAKIIADIKEV